MTIKALTEVEIREEKLVLVREARRLQGDLNDVLGKMAQAGIVVDLHIREHKKEIGLATRLSLKAEFLEKL